MRKDYKPGWFEATEDELERQMLEIRWLYRERDDDSQPAVSPVDLKLGVVDFWSPNAAKQACGWSRG